MTHTVNYPKFLRVAEVPSYNSHLDTPWIKGELVKVAPIEEQVPNPKTGYDCETFRRGFVVVYRRGRDGKWSDRRVQEWKTFERIKLLN